MDINLRKALSMLTAAAIAATLVACGGGAAPQAQEGNLTARPAEDGPLVPYEETITITWGVQTRAVQHFYDNDTYEDNRWSRKIKEDLNIDVQVAFSADTSTDAYRNKMNMLLAAGDLPDIMRWDDRTFFHQAQQAGYLADITDVFAEYASDSLREYQNKYPDSFAGASVDGRLYGFPTMNNNFHQTPFLWIRDDWLKNTNSEPPTTVAEMVELARKFTFEDPDGNGLNDTYGLALGKKLVEANYGNLLGLLGAYGVPATGSPTRGIFFRDGDGKMTYSYIQPGVKDALAVARDMYAEGLIDPEFTVKDVGNMEADIASGKYGMMYHMNWGTWHPYNIIYEEDGTITRPYAIPTVDGVDFNMGIESNMTGNVFMLNSNCKYPEAMIKIINLYNETVLDTQNEQNFKDYWEGDQANLVPAFVESALPENYTDVLFDAMSKGSDADLPVSLKQFYNYVYDFESGTNTDANAFGTWGQLNTRGSMSIALNDYKGHTTTNIMANKRPEIWQQNYSVLESMMETAFTEIINGTKPLDSFDQFVQDWLNAGGQETLDEMEKLYPAE